MKGCLWGMLFDWLFTKCRRYCGSFWYEKCCYQLL